MSAETLAKDEKESGLKGQTLKTAGFSYLGGDAAMLSAGYARGNPATIGGAASWLAGGIFAARYGNPDHQKQLQIEAAKLDAYLASHGITIPDDVRAQSALLAQKSTWEKIEQFLYQHPSEMLNGMYGVGAAMLLNDGIKELRAGAKHIVPEAYTLEKLHTVSSNFWIGAIVLAGALSGILIKEDPEAQKKAEHGNIFQKAWAWVKEKPLRVSGTLYTANNAFLALQAYQDWGARNTLYASKSLKPHHFSIPQLGAYLFANTMLLMSSRDQVKKNEFSADENAAFEDAAARVIAVQKPEIQKGILEDLSRYLAQERHAPEEAPVIAQHLEARIVQLAHAPQREGAGQQIHAIEPQGKVVAMQPQQTLAISA